MTSADPCVIAGVEVTDRALPVDVRSYTERGTLVIGFVVPDVRLSLQAAKHFRAAVDARIARMEIDLGSRRHPQNDPTGH